MFSGGYPELLESCLSSVFERGSVIEQFWIQRVGSVFLNGSVVVVPAELAPRHSVAGRFGVWGGPASLGDSIFIAANLADIRLSVAGLVMCIGCRLEADEGIRGDAPH